MQHLEHLTHIPHTKMVGEVWTLGGSALKRVEQIKLSTFKQNPLEGPNILKVERLTPAQRVVLADTNINISPRTIDLKRRVAYAAMTVLLAGSAINLVWNVIDGAHQASAISGSKKTSETNTGSPGKENPAQEQPLTVGAYISASDKYLDSKDSGEDALSFREQMQVLGHKVSNHMLLDEPIIVQAGKEGLYRRLKPTADDALVNRDIYQRSVYWGETATAFGIIFDETDAYTDIFLLTDPYRVTEIPEAEMTEINADNKVGNKLIEPGYIRLGRMNKDGTTEEYGKIISDPALEVNYPQVEGVLV